MCIRRLVPLVAGIMLTAEFGVAAQERGHVERDLGWSNSAVTNTVLADRIRSAAVEYRSYAPVPRLALFDIAYPKDQLEYRAMNGYALITITAVVQDSTELPIARAYLNGGAVQRDLLRLFTVSSHVDAADSLVATTFGRFRADALYLIPVNAVTRPSELLVDFTTNRSGFRLTAFEGRVPEMIRDLDIAPPTGPPPRSAIREMVTREYPDLERFLGVR